MRCQISYRIPQDNTRRIYGVDGREVTQGWYKTLLAPRSEVFEVRVVGEGANEVNGKTVV